MSKSKEREERRKNTEILKGDRICPKCDQIMQRRKHKEILESIRNQPYYYSQWDYCRTCKHIQHSDEFRVINYDKL